LSRGVTIGVADIEGTHEKLKGPGLVFRTPPTKMGPVTSRCSRTPAGT
jgi:hypothetical protein